VHNRILRSKKTKKQPECSPYVDVQHKIGGIQVVFLGYVLLLGGTDAKKS
jgi:hypothetical protein